MTYPGDTGIQTIPTVHCFVVPQGYDYTVIVFLLLDRAPTLKLLEDAWLRKLHGAI